MNLVSRLDQQVTIQQPVLSDDGYGGKATAWADFATVAAEVQPVYANWSENDVAGQPDARAGYRIVIRGRGDVNAAMRILWKTHILGIHSLHEGNNSLSILTYEENL